MIWNENKMIWKGTITELETNKIYKVQYNGSIGLVQETYIIEDQNGETKLTFVQVCTDQEAANSYKNGNMYTLKAIKGFLEK